MGDSAVISSGHDNFLLASARAAFDKKNFATALSMYNHAWSNGTWFTIGDLVNVAGCYGSMSDELNDSGYIGLALRQARREIALLSDLLARVRMNGKQNADLESAVNNLSEHYVTANLRAALLFFNWSSKEKESTRRKYRTGLRYFAKSAEVFLELEGNRNVSDSIASKLGEVAAYVGNKLLAHGDKSLINAASSIFAIANAYVGSVLTEDIQAA